MKQAHNNSNNAQEIRAIQAVLEATLTIDGAVLFGSFASGQTRPDSDIDLAILSKPL